MTVTAERAKLLADRHLRGGEFCRSYSRLLDEWLQAAFWKAVDDAEGVSLVAVGGYGRGELSPHSDLDLLLLHYGRDVSAIADRLWYPIWDQGLKLGHSVRTVKDALSLALEDLDTATSLLEVRHIAGDEEMSAQLQERARSQWRRKAKKWLDELARAVDDRHVRFGEVAFELEPNLKEGRGGLRDVQALQWARATTAVPLDPGELALGPHYETLLAARVELHRDTNRPGDRLVLQEQDAVADRLGDADADALMKRIAEAGRTIAWRSDEIWHRVKASLDSRVFARFRRDSQIGEGMTLSAGLIHVDDEFDVRADPLIMLRIAAAAAENEARIDRRTMERLHACPAIPVPWPVEARHLFSKLLLSGFSAIPVIESLDQSGLFTGAVPEWSPVRSRPQRNAYHRFTVDRHLCEAAAQASLLAERVDRPDLLVLGSLLHDIGKGHPGDHTILGMDLVRTIVTRMGYDDADIETLVRLVELHLLLPDVATRRDLDDELTIKFVAERVESIAFLRLLHALTEADSIATGPAAWGAWKAELVAELVERVGHVLGGGDIGEVVRLKIPSDRHRELMAGGRRVLEGAEDRLTVVCRDRPGLFSRVAGVLAINGLDILAASAYTDETMALEVFKVESSTGSTIQWERVIADLDRALDGKLAIRARLADRARTYRRKAPRTARPAEPTVTFDNEASKDATYVEVLAEDAIGLLFRLTEALAEMDLDIRSARVQTLGHDVVDSFYLRDREMGKIVESEDLEEIRRAILHALAPVPGYG